MTNDQFGHSTTDQLGKQATRSVLTVEMVLWGIVTVLALVLRLVHLDAAPLNVHEAREAMLAWGAATGQGMPMADYSPVLLAANALLFALCGASDALARLGPALFGGALALTPFLLRERMGRVGALAAGLYLALSPTALVASRQLEGAVVAAVGGMACRGGLSRYFGTERRGWLSLAVGGLALAVTSSSSAYGLLLALGLSWVLLAWIWPNGEVQRLRGVWRLHGRHLLVMFSLVGLALATGLGWNLAGLGAAGDLLMAWLARFGPASSLVASPLTLLVVYEPLALAFGIGGLVWASRRRHRFGVLLGLWAGLGSLMLALMPGRMAVDMLWVVLPLAMLTGLATESLVQALRERGGWLSEGLYVPVVVVLWVHFYLMLARSAGLGSPTELALALLTVALQVLLALIFALAMSVGVAWRALGVGTGVVLLAVVLSAGWGVAYVRPADPLEPVLTRGPTAVGVHDLVQTLRDLSWRETGLPTALPFTLEAAPDSLLAWYLRDFSAARRVENLEAEGEMGATLVTTRRDLGDLMLMDVRDDAVDYVGQDFALRRRWSPLEIGCTWDWPPQCSVAIEWLLFRSTVAPPVIQEWAVLWQRQDAVGE